MRTPPKTLSALLALPMLLAPSAAGASPSSDDTSEIAAQVAALNPGTTPQEVTEAAERWAEEDGSSTEEVLQEFLARSNEEHQANQHALEQFGPTAHTDKLYPQSTAGITPTSGGGGTITLPNGAYKGDVFYTPSAWQPFGHAGIYGGTDWIVEASGPTYKSRWRWSYEVTVRRGGKEVWYHTTQAKQDAAADYAYNHLLGYFYNPHFFSNKESRPALLNCSQLVWYAYKYGAGLDVDGDGGPGVYPEDLTYGPLAHVHRIY